MYFYYIVFCWFLSFKINIFYFENLLLLHKYLVLGCIAWLGFMVILCALNGKQVKLWAQPALLD